MVVLQADRGEAGRVALRAGTVALRDACTSVLELQTAGMATGQNEQVTFRVTHSNKFCPVTLVRPVILTCPAVVNCTGGCGCRYCAGEW